MRTVQLGGLAGERCKPPPPPPILLYITSRFAYMKPLFCWQLILIFLYLTLGVETNYPLAWMFYFHTLATAFPSSYHLKIFFVLVKFENSAMMHAHSTTFPMQGFIQALLLTSVFHEGLSFSWKMCIKMLVLQLGVHMWRCKSPLWSPGTMPLKHLAISLISGFQITLPCIVQWPNLFLF